MNTTEKNTLIKETAAEVCNLNALVAEGKAFRIDTYTFAVPVEVDGTTRYAKIVISATSDKDVAFTKGSRAGCVNKAFNLDEAIATYNEKVVAAAEKAEAKKNKSKKSDAGADTEAETAE